MKKSFIFFAFAMILTNLSVAQSPDSIRMEKVFGGYKYYQGTTLLRMGQLVEIIKPNPVAYEQIKSARNTYMIANTFGMVGGFMVGWPLGTAMGGGEPNWTMAAVGAGLIAVSIPISIKCNNQAKQAVETFNSGLRTSSFWDTHHLNFSVTSNGIGLTLRF